MPPFPPPEVTVLAAFGICAKKRCPDEQADKEEAQLRNPQPQSEARLFNCLLIWVSVHVAVFATY